MDDFFSDWDRDRERAKRPLWVPLDVSSLFEKLTLDLWNAGWEHYSARAVLHAIRWHKHVEVGDRTFKCNNNWTPALARWFHRVHPEMGEFFHTRASPGTGGPKHNLEDYSGPFA